MSASPIPQAALTVSHLNLSVHTAQGIKTLVSDLSLTVHAGQCVALVGESGSGKSLSALACARLLPDAISISGGDVWVGAGDKSVSVFDLARSQMSSVRGRRIGFVFQEPSLALNPVMTVGEQLIEALRLNPAHASDTHGELRAAAVSALIEVGIPNPEARLNDYPLQFSGGQKQRIMIAMALAGQPDVLIADEPTTALDVLIQAQVLRLLKSLQTQRRMALLLITHDLAIVRQMADEVIVMQAGVVVEHTDAAIFFTNPQHPHSQALMAASVLQRQISDEHDTTVASNMLTVDQVNASYQSRPSLWRAPVVSSILQGINLNLKTGQTLAIVGASGSGKTTLAKVLLGLQDRNIRCEGDLTLAGAQRKASDKPSRDWQRTISVVFQDPFASLNPRMRVGELVAEGIRNLRPDWTQAHASETIAQLLTAVDLPTDSLARWPHEFSGGQRQRIAIVRALAANPQLVVLDEPTSALDVTVQARLLKVLVGLQQRFGYSFVLITHNLQVVRALAHHVAVLHDGQVVEYGVTESVLNAPQHPQTQALLAAVPVL